MKELLLELLVCPVCLPNENPLDSRVGVRRGTDIIQGELACPVCSTLYPIRNGIASLLPRTRKPSRTSSKYESPEVLSSYLWAHYGDLTGDENANTCYGEWAGLLRPAEGFSLDAGCAAGRFTFEMSRKSDFAVGLDASPQLVRAARQLMEERRLDFSLALEGRLREERSIVLPPRWESDRVEFIVGDAQALPLRSQSVSSVASLNMVDKVSAPLQHLKECNRVARTKDAQMVFSDPFSWSEDVCSDNLWLGGTTAGLFAGGAKDNVKRLMAGEKGLLAPRWRIEQTGHTWWRIRNHRNHFELIRSCFIRAER